MSDTPIYDREMEAAPVYEMVVREYAWEREQLAKRLCPWSGSALEPRQYDDGPRDPGGKIMSCDVCDCFGFDREDPRIGKATGGPVRVFWAPVGAFEDPNAPTVEEILAMTEFSGTISFYYGEDRLGF